MKKFGFCVGLVLLIISLGFTNKSGSFSLDYNKPVRQILTDLSANVQYQHFVDPSVKGASVERGKEIVTNGFTHNSRGLKTSRISKHFVCTSCHNIVKEVPDLSVIDPQSRLEYTNSIGLPFLQGSPLYGIVNRSSFYNDDYYKKYGELVNAARNDLRQAIQLCSTECSQGRKMKNWELESVLMYLWTLELKLDDLEINGEEEAIIVKALSKETGTEEAIKIIESKYLKSSPAHFIDPPSAKEDRRKVIGNPENGEIIYNNGCMYCHGERKYSFFNLDHSVLTFKNLKHNLDDYHERSIYQVSRYGTKPAAGKKAYMPQYTLEKMSIEQLEDLKAYIVKNAK